MRLRGLWPIAWSEFRLNLRNPAMVFWPIAFPALWMSLFGAIASEPIPGFEYEGLNLANFLLPGGIGLVIVAPHIRNQDRGIAPDHLYPA